MRILKILFGGERFSVYSLLQGKLGIQAIVSRSRCAAPRPMMGVSGEARGS